MLAISDDFIDTIVKAACRLAVHRRSPSVEIDDFKFVLGKFSDFYFRVELQWRGWYELSYDKRTVQIKSGA